MLYEVITMPGSPIIYYGDEIGMGDNIYLGDRNGVRTPTQSSPDPNAGSPRADPPQAGRGPPRPTMRRTGARITSYNVCYTKLLRSFIIRHSAFMIQHSRGRRTRRRREGLPTTA